jgi:hypothetical protein
MQSFEIPMKWLSHPAGGKDCASKWPEMFVRGGVRQWLQEAEPGQALHYFQGFLAAGTDSHGRLLPEPERHALASVASQLWRAAQHHLVHLVQRREGPGTWTYIAIARRRSASNCRNGDAR